MAYIYDIADTWAASGTVFTGIKLSVTDTASAAGSLLMDLQVGGVSRFSVGKTGNILFTGSRIQASTAIAIFGGTGGGLSVDIAGAGDVSTVPFRVEYSNITIAQRASFGFTSGSAINTGMDTIILRDAANTLAQRNGVNAQAFNLYQSYTDASNYERARTGWNANVFEIFSEAAGTGTRRNLSIYAAQTIIDGPADSSYSLRRNGVAQIFAGSAGPRFAQPMYPGSAIVDIGLSSFPFRDIFLKPSASLTPNANGDLCIEATNNTTLTFKLKGSDGTVRSGTVNLA